MEIVSNFLDLSEHELNEIPENLREKLQNNEKNFYDKYETLRGSYEKFKIEYEQRFIDLESEYNECRSKFEVESRDCQIYKSKLYELEEKCKSVNAQIQTLQNEKDTLNSQQQRLSLANQNLESEKRDLIVVLEKRNHEIDRLNEDWKSLNKKLSEFESKNVELTIRVEEFEKRESSIALKETQFQNDKERLMNEIDWLNKQLTQKSNQILELRTSSNNKSYELDTKIDELLAENKKLKSLNESIQKANEDHEQQIRELSEKVHEMRESRVNLERTYALEANAREKLINDYKDENNNCKTKLEEATQVITELNQMLTEIKDEYSNLADDKLRNETILQANIREKDENLARLEQELKNANELLSIAKRKGATVLSEADIEQLSPAAAVASRLLKPGMTLTQMYSEIVNLTEHVSNERAEKERQISYNHEIMKSIEETAPILKRQKLDYEEAKNTVGNLTAQLEKTMIEYEVLKSKSEDSVKKYNFVCSENMRLKQDVADLSRQVTTLLQEVEKLRAKAYSSGKSVRNLDESNFGEADSSNIFGNMFDLNESQVTSTSDFITKNMIEFKTIEDLQKQNQKLIRYARELGESRGSEEKAQLELKTKEYNEKLAMCMKQLEEYRAQREKHEHMLDEIVKQRDSYKHMLTQLQSETSSSPICTSTPGFKASRAFNSVQNDADKANSATQVALEKLQAHYTKFQTEMMETNKNLNEELDKYRKSYSEISTKHALSESKLESATEKFKSLNSNLEKLKRDADILKERNSKANEIIVKHEQALIVANSDLSRAREKMSELETALRSSNVERDLFKSNQERLQRENELLVKENSSRALILTNLETIRSSCERNERETKLIYTEKIDTLTKENTIMRKRLETESEQLAALKSSWESQFREMSERYRVEAGEHEKTRKTFEESQKKFDEVNQKLIEAEAKLHSNEALMQMTRNPKSSVTISRLTELEEECKELQLKLSVAEKEIVGLKMQLEDAKTNSKQFSSIADGMEKALRESSEACEKMKSIYEEKLEKLEKDKEMLEGQLSEACEKKGELERELGSEKEAHVADVARLEKSLNDLKKDFDELNENCKRSEMLLGERVRDIESYVARLTVTEEQLDVELANLNKVRLELYDADGRLKTLGEENARLLDENSVVVKERDEARRQLSEGDVVNKERLETLEKDNEALLKQIEMLQEELARLSENWSLLQQQRDSSMVLEDAGADTRESTSHLLEINRFLRSQKDQMEEKCHNMKLNEDILTQRVAAAEGELAFLKQKIQIFENEIEHYKVKIEQGSGAVESEEYALVMNSNKHLKEQYEAAMGEAAELAERLRNVEAELAVVKEERSTLAIRCETIDAERTCMQMEIGKWKQRLDKLLLGSEFGEELAKAQNEVVELSEAVRIANESVEGFKREIEVVRAEAAGLGAEKVKLTADLEAFKADRVKKEESFRSVISEMRDLILAVQRELELKTLDWASIKGPFHEKVKIIKEELANLKKSIVDKLRGDREELRAKTHELNELKSKGDECQAKIAGMEAELSEKDEKTKQILLKSKEKIMKQAQKIEELNREVQRYQNAAEVNMNVSEGQQALTTTATVVTTAASSPAAAVKTQVVAKPVSNSAATQVTSSLAVTTATTAAVTTAVTSVATGDSQSVASAPPTAYIAPSRINSVKVNPLTNNRPSTVISLNSSFGDSARRTAAVQPTPHETGTQARQLIVSPLNAEANQTWSQQITTTTTQANLFGQLVESSVVETGAREPDTSVNAGASTSTGATPSSNNMSKRKSREDDQSDEPSSTLLSNNKKQKQLETTETNVEMEQIDSANPPQVATIEPYNLMTNEPPSETEYITVPDESINNEVEVEQVQEEIIIDETSSASSNLIDESPDILLSDPNGGYEDTNEAREQRDQNANSNLASANVEEYNENSNNSVEEELHLELQPDDEVEEQQQLEGDGNELEGNNDNLDIQDVESQEQMGGDEAEFSQDNNLENTDSAQNASNRAVTSSANQIMISSTQQASGKQQTTGTPTFATSSANAQNSEKREPIKPIVWDVDNSAASTSTLNPSVQQTPVAQPIQTQQPSSLPIGTTVRLRRHQGFAASLQAQQHSFQMRAQSPQAFAGGFQLQTGTVLSVDQSALVTPPQNPQRIAQQRFIQTRSAGARLPINQMQPQQQQQQQVPQQQMQQQTRLMNPSNMRGNPAARGAHRGGRGGNVPRNNF